ncbi:MAG: low molecular weight protein arginine phosphatase [Chloroflexi bacterium]|jgi:protein-tyrosine-phosphatase|nr:hypothetical protein [Anaerolineaceae bacterium]NLI45073.1 low molecular weight protein arginine phosphatase [Chloroflexota bacterium]HOE35425.1 hypothetical protein [Anaerolineaceae bacterium]HOT25104.1 hypothetical protein [Anaerolineaceae bacterium]HQH58059.1 hypothetical protein [Anaerolineaceae bacterium]
MPGVLFVCTANRFRSPLAQVIFQGLLRKMPSAADWRVESAGTWGDPNLPAMPEAVEEARKRNLNLDNHRSRLLTPRMMNQFDLVLVMETGHKEALQAEFPTVSSRIYLLSEVCGGVPFSIPDPYASGDSPAEVAREIDQLITSKFALLYQWLMYSAKKTGS